MSEYLEPGSRSITRPETSPELAGLLNLVLGGLGYLYLGQIKKGLVAILICTIGGCASFGLFYLFALVTAYDGYLLGLKLRSGQSIRPSENGLELLDPLFRD